MRCANRGSGGLDPVESGRSTGFVHAQGGSDDDDAIGFDLDGWFRFAPGCVQEQQALIEAQQARIAKLEQARPPSVLSGGLGAGVVVALAPLGLLMGLRRRKERQV